VKKEDKNHLSNLLEDFNINLKKIADEKGYHAAMKYFSSVSSNLKKYCQFKPNFIEKKYPLESYPYLQSILDWIKKIRVNLD
jgi:hypothetical protein